MGKNEKKIELLAPAGGTEHFYAACENGADAIYFGGRGFNARALADNFEYEEMKAAIAYAHSKGVKSYMTLNTLIKEAELSAALKQAEEGAKAGIDALIVQDLGLVSQLEKHYPEIDLHLSTQGTVYDKEGLIAAREFGFKRAVLARELSIEEINECCTAEGIETEVFVHGALCMCLSGQCAMSSLIGERSGNRGTCAQPCRKAYTLVDEVGLQLGEAGYLLSPKDISYLDELDGIIAAGVTSIKIEGRMKTPEYTALTVKTYRKYIDEYYTSDEYGPIEKEDKRKLEQIFSRGGFSRGYLHGRQNGGLLSGESPKHRGLFLGTVKTVKPSRKNRGKSVVEIDIKENLAVGDGVEVITRGFPGGIVSYISGKNGVSKSAESGEKIFIGDIPGSIKAGDLVYKVSDAALMKNIAKTYNGAFLQKDGSCGESSSSCGAVSTAMDEKISIRGRFLASEGLPVKYIVADEAGNEAEALGETIIEAAINSPATEEQVLKQLKKTGNTPYVLKSADIVINGQLMIPVKEVNKVRREALALLESRSGK